MSAVVTCPGCQRQYAHPLELNHVHPLGLALVGECPVCGTRVGLNPTWNCRARFDYLPPESNQDQSPPKKPDQPSLL